MKRLLNLDAVVSSHLHDKTHVPKSLMVAVTHLGAPTVLSLIAVMLALIAYIYGQQLVTLGLGLCLVALVISGILKLLLRRTRPETVYVSAMRFKTFSFPSGHSLGTLVLHGYISAVLWLYAPGAVALVGTLFLATLVVATGLSRIYLGAHYISDVLGGWLLGSLALIVIIGSTL